MKNRCSAFCLETKSRCCRKKKENSMYCAIHSHVCPAAYTNAERKLLYHTYDLSISNDENKNLSPLWRLSARIYYLLQVQLIHLKYKEYNFELSKDEDQNRLEKNLARNCGIYIDNLVKKAEEEISQGRGNIWWKEYVNKLLEEIFSGRKVWRGNEEKITLLTTTQGGRIFQAPSLDFLVQALFGTYLVVAFEIVTRTAYSIQCRADSSVLSGGDETVEKNHILHFVIAKAILAALASRLSGVLPEVSLNLSPSEWQVKIKDYFEDPYRDGEFFSLPRKTERFSDFLREYTSRIASGECASSPPLPSGKDWELVSLGKNPLNFDFSRIRSPKNRKIKRQQLREFGEIFVEEEIPEEIPEEYSERRIERQPSEPFQPPPVQERSGVFWPVDLGTKNTPARSSISRLSETSFAKPSPNPESPSNESLPTQESTPTLFRSYHPLYIDSSVPPSYYPPAPPSYYPPAPGGYYPQAPGGYYPPAPGGYYPPVPPRYYPQAPGGYNPQAPLVYPSRTPPGYYNPPMATSYAQTPTGYHLTRYNPPMPPKDYKSESNYEEK